MTQKYKKNTYHKAYTINFFISLHIKTSCKQNGKDSFCMPRQYLPQSDG